MDRAVVKDTHMHPHKIITSIVFFLVAGYLLNFALSLSELSPSRKEPVQQGYENATREGFLLIDGIYPNATREMRLLLTKTQRKKSRSQRRYPDRRRPHQGRLQLAKRGDTTLKERAET